MQDWQIAGFRFVPDLNQLGSADGNLHLEPRTTAVLLDLVEHAGVVRTRDELLDAVWDDAFVGEAALTHCIWELRKAFGDDARSPRFIQTVPRRGYRLIAEVARSSQRRLATILWLDGEVTLAERPIDAVRRASEAPDTESDDASDVAPPRAVVHLGEVDASADDASPVLDETTAALIEALGAAARPGQILLTAGAFDLARRADGSDDPSAADRRWEALGPFEVDGLDEPIELFEVADTARETPVAAPRLRRLEDDDTILGWRPGPGIAVPQRPHWVLLDKLGEGTFGEVWLAEHRKTRDRRVFKFCFEAERLRALQREVTLLRLLKESLGQRDDIVHLLDWNFDQAPYFLEMEHTSAGSLDAWALDRGGLDKVPLDDRLELVAQTAEALAAAHSVGVLHKDVKPANILVHVDHEGRPRARLGDFGIGRILDPRQLEDAGITVLGLTRLDDVASSSDGTRLYMAPETLEGRLASTEADVYALGVVLYQAAVGDFRRAVAEGWQRAVDDPVLAADIAECLDQSPARRPSARDLVDRIRRLSERRAERQRTERERQEAEANRRALAAAQRRRRRWLVAAVLASLVAIVVTTLAVQATRARAAAERSQLQAEDLVSYMLGDLSDTLGAVGRLDAMDGTLEKVLEYLGGADPATLDDANLGRRIEALHQVGTLRVQQGELDAARAVYEDAATLARRLLDRDPERAMWRALDADSRFWVGFVDDRRGDLDGAATAYEAHRAAYESLVEDEPENADWRLELAYGHHNVAHIALRRGDLDAALADYQRGRDLLDDLTNRDVDGEPDDTLLLDLADSHNRIGLIQKRRGRLDEALASYAADREIVDGLAKRKPDDTRRRERLATSDSYLASVLLDMGRPTAALDAARRNVAIRRELLTLEPENAEWRRFLAIDLRHLGEALIALGADDEARRELDAARRLLEALHDESSGTVTSRRMLGDVLRLLAESLHTRSDGPAASGDLEASLVLLETLAARHPDDAAVANSLARAHLLHGDWLAADAPVAARAAWRRAVDTVAPLAATSEDPALRASWALGRLRLGDDAEAAATITELYRSGYRSATFVEACRRGGIEPRSID